MLGTNPEGDDGQIRPTLTILDAGAGRAVAELSGEPPRVVDSVNGVAVSPAGDRVAAAFADQKAELRDGATGALVATFAAPECELQAAAFAPDGTALVLAGLAPLHDRNERLGGARTGGYLAAWDLATGRPRWVRISAATSKLRGVAYSPDGRLIATADNEATITLWDAPGGTPMRRLRGHRRLVSWVAFRGDGRRLASASWDQTARVWDVDTGHALVTLRGHMRSVLCVAFSPDGTRVATSSEDQTVKLWDAATGEEVLTLRGHNGVVSTIAFSPDGRRLASGGADGAVLIREADPPSPQGVSAKAVDSVSW
jgi:WD40 repeat protein